MHNYLHEINPEKIVFKERDVGFLLPVVNGEIWLGQRGTKPFKGHYGAIGGKNEYKNEDHKQSPFEKPTLITKPGGHQVHSISDQQAKKEGRELLTNTAAREFCEEIFSNLTYPNDFSETDITDMFRLGWIIDYTYEGKNQENKYLVGRNFCYFFLANVNRTDFSPSPREITNFKPIDDLIETDNIFLLTQLALEQIRYLYEDFKPELWPGMAPYKNFALNKQLPLLNIQERRFNTLFATAIYFSEHNTPYNQEIHFLDNLSRLG